MEEMMPNCLFCQIIRRERPAHIVYEDENTVVIKDINPQAPHHLLAIPKAHHSGVHEVPPEEASFFEGLFRSISAALTQEKIADKGYRLVINSGAISGQSIPHIHVHILSGRAMRWPPG
jgi:histidine triad (HIT) family protein